MFECLNCHNLQQRIAQIFCWGKAIALVLLQCVVHNTTLISLILIVAATVTGCGQKATHRVDRAAQKVTAVPAAQIQQSNIGVYALSQIPDQIMDENSTLLVPFEMNFIPGNANTNNSSPTANSTGANRVPVCDHTQLSYISTSETLLAKEGGIIFSGTWPHCSATVIPEHNANGLSIVTLQFALGENQTEQSFKLTVNPVKKVNEPPTDISISGASIAENSGVNAVVGTLSATDADAGDSQTFSLVTGTGSTDNALFNISGSELRASNSLDFETQHSFSLRIRATDVGGATFDKVFAISATDLNDVTPVIGIITNKSTKIDTASAAIAVYVSDADGPSQTCDSSYLAYTSDATSVVGNSNAVTWGGTWPDCTAVITPVATAVGTANIGIKAFDGANWGDYRTLVLTVYQKPTLSYASATGTSGTVGVAMSVSPTSLNSYGAALTSCTTSPQTPRTILIIL